MAVPRPRRRETRIPVPEGHSPGRRRIPEAEAARTDPAVRAPEAADPIHPEATVRKAAAPKAADRKALRGVRRRELLRLLLWILPKFI